MLRLLLLHVLRHVQLRLALGAATIIIRVVLVDLGLHNGTNYFVVTALLSRLVCRDGLLVDQTELFSLVDFFYVELICYAGFTALFIHDRYFATTGLAKLFLLVALTGDPRIV